MDKFVSNLVSSGTKSISELRFIDRSKNRLGTGEICIHGINPAFKCKICQSKKANKYYKRHKITISERNRYLKELLKKYFGNQCYLCHNICSKLDYHEFSGKEHSTNLILCFQS
jgi:uncharacterized protein YcbX